MSSTFIEDPVEARLDSHSGQLAISRSVACFRLKVQCASFVMKRLLAVDVIVVIGFGHHQTIARPFIAHHHRQRFQLLPASLQEHSIRLSDLTMSKVYLLRRCSVWESDSQV